MTKKQKPGRPTVDESDKRILISLRLPKWVVDAIDAMNGRTAIIEKAILKFYKLKKPKAKKKGGE